MKQPVKVILLILALAAVLTGAWFGYRALSKDYIPEAARPASSAQDTAQSESQAREMAPDFAVLDGDGNTVQLSEHFGKPVVVNFWASWCGPCCSELPAFDTVYEAYKDRVTFLMVNLTDGERESLSSAKTFLKNNTYSFPVYYDTQSAAALAYEIYSIPTTVLLRPDGSIYTTQIGAMQEQTLRDYIEALLNE